MTPPRSATVTSTCVALACLRALVSASRTDRIDERLGRLVVPVKTRPNGDLEAGALPQLVREHADRAADAVHLERRRAQLEAEPAGPLGRLGERLARARGRALAARAASPCIRRTDHPVEPEERRRHHLDRVVVKLAGDAVALLLLGRDHRRQDAQALPLALAQEPLRCPAVGDVGDDALDDRRAALARNHAGGLPEPAGLVRRPGSSGTRRRSSPPSTTNRSCRSTAASRSSGWMHSFQKPGSAAHRSRGYPRMCSICGPRKSVRPSPCWTYAATGSCSISER